MQSNNPERVSFALLSAMASAALLTIASSLQAQSCVGTGSASNATYQYERRSVGSSNGASLNLVGSHVAFGLDGRLRNIASNVSGQEGALRFTVIIPAQRVRICPLIRLGAIHDTWDVRSGVSVTSLTVALAAGVGLGFEQPVYKALALAPFASVAYGFNAAGHDVSGISGTSEITGDTLSGITMNYGVIARMHRFYAGFDTYRAPGFSGKSPTAVRWLVGVMFADPKPRK